VTAFHPGHAVHGKHGEPCPVCGTPVQRIRYADRETDYCPGCQTAGGCWRTGPFRASWGTTSRATLEELEELRDARRRP
jgi:formamidopyrimidine-DNA glycosylase